MLDDEALLEGFEKGTIPAAEFHHPEHVRVAWMYLRRYPLPDALVPIHRVAQALRGRPWRAGSLSRDHHGRLRAHHRRPPRRRDRVVVDRFCGKESGPAGLEAVRAREVPITPTRRWRRNAPADPSSCPIGSSELIVRSLWFVASFVAVRNYQLPTTQLPTTNYEPTLPSLLSRRYRAISALVELSCARARHPRAAARARCAWRAPCPARRPTDRTS